MFKIKSFLFFVIIYLFTISNISAQAEDSLSTGFISAGKPDSFSLADMLSSNMQEPDFTGNTEDSARGINFSKRKKIVVGSHLAAYVGGIVVLNEMWYKGADRTKFHFFNDNSEWNQMDKVGHSWSAYQLSRVSYATWKWAGYSDKRSAIYSSLSSALLMTTIETLDGFSERWGWSWGDFGANTFGSAFFVGQHLLWGKQIVSFKFSYRKVTYDDDAVNRRADVLFGTSFSERVLKDYNGQTLWLSANLNDMFPKSNLPKWLNIAVGYGNKNLIGAGYNDWHDPVTGIDYHVGELYPRTRLWYLSPDIDFTKIKTNSRFLKSLFFALNAFKMPAPAMFLEKGKLKFKAIHF
ncbi:DUF2279 domain-containing protein [Polluticaenibacter yanchengensis]|uniref:DUF2279 domain-containing protein n=1 Tax=Polluticaenibacter yanchengensis TaxID=3014562 RepID=A0ABT4UGL9_9BACT|nr:DUF2279 domain-containing protein [Chitinophagaceae bacterium LY-5]